jgi:hypothetical protein
MTEPAFRKTITVLEDGGWRNLCELLHYHMDWSRSQALGPHPPLGFTSR